MNFKNADTIHKPRWESCSITGNDYSPRLCQTQNCWYVSKTIKKNWKTSRKGKK